MQKLLLAPRQAHTCGLLPLTTQAGFGCFMKILFNGRGKRSLLLPNGAWEINQTEVAVVLRTSEKDEVHSETERKDWLAR